MARIDRLDLRIVTLDIERLPGRAVQRHRGLEISGRFWDLNAFKSVTGRRIHPDEVTQWPSTICVAWRVYGREHVHTAAAWGQGGYEGMLRRVWGVLDAADVVVGHNISAFDIKKLNSEFALAGLTPPSPYATVDTLTVARKAFGFESNSLDSLCQRLGVPAKRGAYSIQTAEAAMAGNRTAQRELLDYNRGDIVATEALYDALRPWIRNHPHPHQDAEPSCHACGSLHLVKNGWHISGVFTYQRYVCRGCGAHVRGRHRLTTGGRRTITAAA